MFNKKLSRRDFLRMSAAGGAAVATAGLPLAGLAARPAEQQLFLNYWTGWSGFEFDVLQGLVDQFNSEHPDIFTR